MLPSGWSIKQLGEIAKVTSGGTPSRESLEYWINGSIPWIRTTDVQNCVLNIEDTQEFITELGLKNSSAKLLPVGTILLAMIGQGKTRGQVALLKFQATTNQNSAAIILNKDNDPEFHFNYLLSQYQNIRGASNSAGQSNLSGGLVKEIKVPVPPLGEQKKIAKILSTWDNAIATTEKLLENSKKQKYALMQQLLTGKKRFPSFKGGWATSKVQNLVTISKGEQLNRDGLIESDIYPVINGGISPSGYTDKANNKANTITISEGGNSCGYVALQSSDFWCGGHCYALKTPKLPLLFLYQLLKFNERKIMSLRVGSGLPNIQKKDLDALHLTYPVDTEEQMKIAAVLSTADEKIKSLEKKLDFLKEEKKALMQQLLTGKRTVKVDL